MPGTPGAPGTPDMQIFTNNAGKVGIMVPKTWVGDWDKVNHKQLFYDPQNNDLIISLGVYTPLANTPFPSSDVSPQDVADKILKDSPTPLNVLDNNYNPNLNEQTISYTFDRDGTKYFEHRIYRISNGILYEFVATVPTSAVKGYADLLSQISSSWLSGDQYDEVMTNMQTMENLQH